MLPFTVSTHRGRWRHSWPSHSLIQLITSGPPLSQALLPTRHHVCIPSKSTCPLASHRIEAHIPLRLLVHHAPPLRSAAPSMDPGSSGAFPSLISVWTVASASCLPNPVLCYDADVIPGFFPGQHRHLVLQEKSPPAQEIKYFFSWLVCILKLEMEKYLFTQWMRN